MAMAEEHFRELNPRFTPAQDWKASYSIAFLAIGAVHSLVVAMDGESVSSFTD